MRGEEVNATHLGRTGHAGCLKELHRTVNLLSKRLITRISRISSKTTIPVMHKPQVSIATSSEGTNQIQRRCGMMIQIQQARGIWNARLGSEFEGIDSIASV